MTKQEAVRALKANPDDLSAWAWLGRALEREGHWDKARECYERVLRLHPSDEIRDKVEDALASVLAKSARLPSWLPGLEEEAAISASPIVHLPENQAVTLTDLDVSFQSLVVFLVKVGIASIPAGIILAVLYFLCWVGFIGGLLGSS